MIKKSVPKQSRMAAYTNRPAGCAQSGLGLPGLAPGAMGARIGVGGADWADATGSCEAGGCIGAGSASDWAAGATRGPLGQPGELHPPCFCQQAAWSESWQ